MSKVRKRQCNDCGAEMVWAYNTARGRWSPLDARPWKNLGNIHLDTIEGTFIELEPAMIDQAHARGIELYTDHRNTCPARERSRYQETFGQQEREIYEHAS